jgi:hypothetical protein
VGCYCYDIQLGTCGDALHAVIRMDRSSNFDHSLPPCVPHSRCVNKEEIKGVHKVYGARIYLIAHRIITHTQ